MATNGGPNIIEDGLVFAVDAANKKSYPGSGTTWSDLAGNNNGTLINGPTFDSANGGVIDFDGSNDKSNFPDSDVYNFTSSDAFSLETFCYASQAAPSGMIPLIERYYWNTEGKGGYVLRLRTYSTNYPIFSVNGKPIGSSQLSYSVQATTEWVPNTWYHIIGTKSTGGILKIYVNSIHENTTTIIGDLPQPSSGTTLKIGARGDTNNQYAQQKFSVCKIYNKELSPLEVTQNYNALKSRFGL
jgi:hypothetical protein